MNDPDPVALKMREFLLRDLALNETQPSLDVNDSLINSGLVDSLSIATLVAFIEAEFQVVLEFEDMVADNFETLARIASLVTSRYSPKA